MLKRMIEEAECRSAALVNSDPNRLKLHLMPPVGWLNDPNGLCQWNGTYHVFFQYSPESAEGNGLKAWGHYTSEDLLQWEKQETKFLPDQAFDKDGVYSGSACIDQGKMYLYYTGNVKEEGMHDYTTSGRGANTVLIESIDGVHFSEKKLLMTNADYPADYTCHVRDPKVWKKDGRFYMVQGGRKYGQDREDRDQDFGAVLLFESRDANQFHFVKEITAKQPFGYMWECPDYFELDDAKILSFSPQGVPSEEYRYQNIYQSGYLLLENAPEKWAQQEITDTELFHEWDMGFDFYAPQTFLAEDGRRILIGWAGIPDAEYDNEPTVKMGWQHALTLPRELTVKAGKVYQNPVKELENLRMESEQISVEMPVALKNNVFELLVENENAKEPVCIRISDGKECLLLKFDIEKRVDTTEKGVLSLHLSEGCGRGRKLRKVQLETLENVRIYADTSMVEIYVNDGETVMTSRFYMENETREIKISGNTKNTLWYLKGLQIE